MLNAAYSSRSIPVNALCWYEDSHDDPAKTRVWTGLIRKIVNLGIGVVLPPIARPNRLSVGKTDKRPFHRTSEYRLHPGSDNTPLRELKDFAKSLKLARGRPRRPGRPEGTSAVLGPRAHLPERVSENASEHSCEMVG